MRLWHRELLPYLPDAQFKGQLRELVLIMRTWRDTGKTNHLLINRVMEYPKSHLYWYFNLYNNEYEKRYRKRIKQNIVDEFGDFYRPTTIEMPLFSGWHNKEYLRVCVCNLYEKFKFGVGKSKISQTEWDRILKGYENITGEKWVL